MDKERMEAAVSDLLSAIGPKGVNDEVLANTPRRIAEMYAEFFRDMSRDPADVLQVQYHEQYEEMVVMRNIAFFSICEHHFLPFIGTADVVYIPKGGRIVGASKLARAVDIAASRPQLQERLTQQVADALVSRLDPIGVMVRLRATHLCMTLRGVKKAGSQMVTSAIRGSFHKNPATRAEALSLLSEG